jgi:hypothetical protein
MVRRKSDDFVDGSMKMGASDFKAKHVITSPFRNIRGSTHPLPTFWRKAVSP